YLPARAQARLVALGMSLGMAEQKLKTDPEAAEVLLAEARRGAGEALEELRVLARGIHPPILTGGARGGAGVCVGDFVASHRATTPPILTDRGLEAAVTALTALSPVPVKLSVDV